MKNLRTILKIIGAVLMGACVGTGLANFMKGDQADALMMAMLSVINLGAVLTLVLLEDEWWQ
ncbi:MAG: hypothetical protein J6T99_09500 [Oscillospiraceae bacterium]|nr:hypothetical protein [Oscillospiraceae bacterium]